MQGEDSQKSKSVDLKYLTAAKLAFILKNINYWRDEDCFFWLVHPFWDNLSRSFPAWRDIRWAVIFTPNGKERINATRY